MPRRSDMPRFSRRSFVRSLALAGTLAVAHLAARHTHARLTAEHVDEPSPARFPALDLKITTPPIATATEVDFRAWFGAAGDGLADDGPAFRALAEAANSGRIAPGAVVVLAAGTYRVVGNETVTFRQPVVLRGEGPAATRIRLEYTAQRSVFLRAQGRGMYVRHSTGHYSFGQDQNRYPNAPYSPVRGRPTRGDLAVSVDRPELFGAGAQVYLLCDDYGEQITYAPNNTRSEHFLLKQHLAVVEVSGDLVRFDTPLRHDFAGAEPRLYRWEPLHRFGLEHLAILDAGGIPDTEEANTFRAVHLDGVVDGWVWDVHFLDNTSIPLSVGRSRRVVVCEALFNGARHVGGGGNGYLPELIQSDDCLVEYCTSRGGRHALICNWTSWGNVFRYNRVVGTPNTETHGEYNVENLYLRNDARGARMEIGGGGDRVHAHDGPFNELRENYARVPRVLKRLDRASRLIGNWHVEPIVDAGAATIAEGNQLVPPDWDAFPFAAHCGHDHSLTAETARPIVG